MEVVRPSPLPAKSNGSFQSLKQSIIVRNEEPDVPRKDVNFIGKSDGKSNFVTKIAESGPKITTWARKNSETKNRDSSLSINFYKPSETSQDDEFVYQNVSKNGTNYIEYKLNGIINNSESAKNLYNEKTQGNPKIEVHQVKNKTVVKISIEDDDQVYQNSYLGKYSTKIENSAPKSLIVNCDDYDYETVHDKYRSMDDQLYANLNASDPECDQTYENQEFDAKSALEKTSSEQIYENQMITKDDGLYENVGDTMLKDEKPVIELKNQCVRLNVQEEDEKRDDYQKSRKVVVTIGSLQSDSEDGRRVEDGLGHKRAESLTSSGVGVDSEESDGEESNISCDSLNSHELNVLCTSEDHGYHTPENKTASPVDDYQNICDYENAEFEGIYENFQVLKKKAIPPPPPPKPAKTAEEVKSLPKGLLRDIESRNVKLTAPEKEEKPVSKRIITFNNLTREAKPEGRIRKPEIDVRKLKVEERTYEERKKTKMNGEKICAIEVDTDKFYKFHLFENRQDANGEKNVNDEETFAGVKDYLNREKQAAIKSAKGTIRGVKNRVKAGIATFLQMQENKTYKDRDAGKIVVYSTTMGIVRETYHKCLKVKQILKTLMVKFEERDVFMSTDAQEEIRERMKCEAIMVPQVFVEGQHIGDAETIERLNESGELRKILKPYKSADACSTCQVCGGYRLLPCSVCKGSKKSIHRNHFTAEFVALKCMNCDQVGLTKCHAC